MRIFCSHHNTEYFNFAKALVENFVSQCVGLFGELFIVYNVHSLCQISEDVLKFGVLDSFSCFQYENFLRFIKKVIRSPRKPLQQLVRRVLESDQSLGHCHPPSKSDVCLLNEIQPINIPSFDFGRNVSFYSKMIIENGSCLLQADTPNQFVYLKNANLQPFKISYFARDRNSNDIFLVGQKLALDGNIFDEPLPSSKVGLTKIRGYNTNEKLKVIPLSEVSGKGMLLAEKYFITVLHTSTYFQ